MMPGATPPIAGLQLARQKHHPCRALGLCQLREPRCLDCDAPPPAVPAPSQAQPQPGAKIIDITQHSWGTRQAPWPLRQALHDLQDPDPDADTGLGRAILRGLWWTVLGGCIVFTAAGGLGYAWVRWLAPVLSHLAGLLP